jgi:hypothetical protein
MSLIPEAEEQIFYFGPKATFYTSENFSMSAGFMFANLLNKSFGTLYSVGTLGSPFYSFTAGIGVGFSDGELADTPMLMFGGEAQASNSVKFISENWILPDGSGLFSAGLRFFGQHIAVDFALLIPSEAGTFIPWVSFVVNY